MMPSSKTPFPTQFQGLSWRIPVCLVVLTLAVEFSIGTPISPGRQGEIKRCCLLDLESSAPFNKTDCFKLIKTELELQEVRHTRTFKYMRRLWRFVSIATRKHERMDDESVGSWRVNAYKPVPELITDNTIVYNRTLTPDKTDVTNDTTSGDVLTRLELLIPYYYVRPVHSCPRKAGEQRNITVSYNGQTFSQEKGTVPFRKILIFRLPHTPSEDAVSNRTTITLNMDLDLVYVHPKGSLLLEYFNMNETITDEIRQTAIAKLSRKIKMFKKQEGDEETGTVASQSHKEKQKGASNTRRIRSVQLHRGNPIASHFCQVRDYNVDFKAHLNMISVVNPLKMNIGMCSGKCNALNLFGADRHSTGRSAILNLMSGVPKTEKQLRSQCVPDLMSVKSVLFQKDRIMYVWNIKAVAIKSCRCV